MVMRSLSLLEQECMPRKREVSYDPQIEPPRRIKRRALTEMQALMEAKPHEPVEPSIESLLPLRDILAVSFAELSERDQWIVNSIRIERKSIRRTGKDLSLAKSHVDRLYKKALTQMRTSIIDNPVITEYLARGYDYD